MKGFDSFPWKLRKQKSKGGEPLTWGQGSDRQEDKKWQISTIFANSVKQRKQ